MTRDQPTSPWLLRVGRTAAPPTPLALRAGPVSLLFDGGDLRHFTVGGIEVLRRIYAAVRDRDWGTVPQVLSNVVCDQYDDHFVLSFDMACQADPIDFVWKGTVQGSADGVVTFTFSGTARTTFFRNRLGFCVLYPAACTGLPARVAHIDGSSESTTFPDLIDPDQPMGAFADLRSIHHKPAPGVGVDVHMEGDTFEAEDQRNWTDGSYKIFCTPLALPFPVQIHAGTAITQRITVSVAASSNKDAPDDDQATTLSFELTGARPFPQLGLGLASHGQALNANAIEHLLRVRPAHLRVDWRATSSPSENQADLERAAGEAQALHCGLELALSFEPAEAPLLVQVASFLKSHGPSVRRILVYPGTERYKGGAPMRALIDATRTYLGAYMGTIPLAAGTNADFIFFGRNRPPMDLLDAVTFAANPQVHAFDEASLVQTLEAQEAVVRTAAHHAGGKPVFASPVTLKPRYNPYATAAAAPVAAGHLPPPVDPRQRTLFAAGWTIGALRALATAGVASITLFETTGWRGLLELESGAPEPALFPSAPGEVFPVHGVLAAVAGATQFIPTTSSDRLKVEALALRHAGGDLTILVANHSAQPQTARLQGLPSGEQAVDIPPYSFVTIR